MKQYISSNKRDGFTIVELLIVIVVIAILAAITIVSYNGITSRANSTAAQASGASIMKKLEAYNAEEGSYPTAITDLTGGTGKSYQVSSGIISGTAITASTAPAVVNIYRCPASGTPTGAQVRWWKYDGTVGVQTITAGTQTGCTIIAS